MYYSPPGPTHLESWEDFEIAWDECVVEYIVIVAMDSKSEASKRIAPVLSYLDKKKSLDSWLNIYQFDIANDDLLACAEEKGLTETPTLWILHLGEVRLMLSCVRPVELQYWVEYYGGGNLATIPYDLNIDKVREQPDNGEWYPDPAIQ